MDQMKSKDRAYLRSEAQTLSPVVYVGKNGLTDSVVAALDEALDLVATTGFTAVFYRRNPDPEKRKYYF